MKAWITSTLGKIVSAAVIILLLIGVWKFGTIKDAIQAKWFNTKTISSQAHGDSATIFKAVADTAHAQGTIVRSKYNALTSSVRVRSNPVAVEVSHSANAVIAKSDTEVVNLRSANTQLQRQVDDLSSRGQPPQPRAVVYIDPLYSFSNKRRAMIVGRVGIDYRLLSHVSAKAELGYMPPTANDKLQKPEFVVNVGAHITF